MSDNSLQKGEKGGNSLRDIIERGQHKSKAQIPTSPFVNRAIPSEEPSAETPSQARPLAEQPNSEPQHIATHNVNSNFDQVRFVDSMFSTSTRYENGKQTVMIAHDFKILLDTLSKVSGTDISQILNNILNQFLGHESPYSCMLALHEYIQKRQQVINQHFKISKTKL